MKILPRDEIARTLAGVDLLPAIEAAFVAYSGGRAVVPPVGELLLERGDVHIKYGTITGDPYYVVKIASGFYDNPRLGLPSSNGLMLLFRQSTGELAAVLLDEGLLTDTRTAAAGAVAARHLAPRHVERIGIAGTGTQARLQLSHLRQVTDCRQVLVWGRGEPQLVDYRNACQDWGFEIGTTLEAAELLATCNLVVTATPSTKPLLHAGELRPGTHVTAVGSDTADKQELDPAILARADRVVADSIAQCLERGEIHRALQEGAIGRETPVELGNVIAGKVDGRRSDAEVTVCDLTGVAVQDLAIATAVVDATSAGRPPAR